VDRVRVCAAVIRQGTVLMVKYRALGRTGKRDGTETWILPGGAIEPGETPEEAVLRELKEESGLEGRVKKPLFTYQHPQGPSTCFLVEVDPQAEAVLGYDPDLIDKPPRLVDITWLPLSEIEDTLEGPHLLASLSALEP
jgi:8-oxo-dGTP diphosphatase